MNGDGLCELIRLHYASPHDYYSRLIGEGMHMAELLRLSTAIECLAAADN